MTRRIPAHVGIIPDGNRRWATGRGLPKEAGYDAGLAPGLALFGLCREAGVREVTFYGFTQENAKRPRVQVNAFRRACVEAVDMLAGEEADLLVVGDSDSPVFPDQLLPYRQRAGSDGRRTRLNFLVNYSLNWDLGLGARGFNGGGRITSGGGLRTAHIPRVDLIIRWGGRRRLSGFLPIQSAYSDFYVVEQLWPDFRPEHFHEALEWYQAQDVTLGG